MRRIWHPYVSYAEEEPRRYRDRSNLRSVRGKFLRKPSALEVESAEEPEHKQDNQNKAQNAAKSGSPITPITVVTSTAAEKQDKDDNYNY
jgi:hypothetical protein